MFVLRDYQQECVDKVSEFLEGKKKAPTYQVVPTAGGKSLIIANAIKNLPDKTFLSLQPSKELLEQNYEKYCSYGEEAGIYSASKSRREIKHVTFGTVGSLYKQPSILDNFDHVIIDECFPYNTIIATNKGNFSIGFIKKKFDSGEDLLIKSYNEQSGKVEFKKLISATYKGKRDLIKLQLSHGKQILCTGNHLILTTNGWKKASDINTDDLLLCSTKSPNSKSFYKRLNEDQRIIFLASSIGDGCLSNINQFSARVRFRHSVQQEEYIKWKALMFSNKSLNYTSENGFSKKPSLDFSTDKYILKNYSKENVINNLNFKMLAILWMDDGSLNTEISGQLHTFAYSKELSERLVSKLNELGFFNLVSKKSKSGYYYIPFNKLNVNFLFTNIAKFTHPSMIYKVNKKYHNHVGKYKWNVEQPLSVLGVKSKILNYQKDKEVLDIGVEDNHNFIVLSDKARKDKNINDGVIVHNCHTVPPNKNSMYRKFLSGFKGNIIGFTATPFRLKSSMLKMIHRMRPKFFNSVNHVVQIKEMLDSDYWSKLVYHDIDWDDSKLILNSTGSDYTKESIDISVESQGIPQVTIDYIQDAIKRGRSHILVFTTDIEMSNYIVDNLPSTVAGSTVSSKTPREIREERIKRFKSGEIKCMVNVGIFQIGFDYDKIDCIIISRPTNSLALYYQILGRGVRVHPDKDYCEIIDLTGNHKRFGDVEDLEVKEDDYYGWGLFSNKKVLTGVYLDAPPVYIGQTPKNQEVVMPNGKFVGMKLEHIDSWYLRWVAKKYHSPRIRYRALEVLKERENEEKESSRIRY